MTANAITLDPGVGGSDIATDLISAKNYQIVKLTFGALDSQTIASSGTGTDDAGTQRVTLATDISLPPPGVAATSLGKAEDAGHSSGDTGVMGLGVRADTLVSLAGTNADYVPMQFSDIGALWTEAAPNLVDSNNSSASTLTSASSFEPANGTDVRRYTAVTIMIDASHDSAVDGMQFQFSTDDTNWDSVHTHTYSATNGARVFTFGIHAQYFRVSYTNGGTGQTHFRCQTILHRTQPERTIHRLVDDVDPDRSSTLSKSIILAQAAGTGDFTPMQATAGGNFKTAIEEFDAALLGGGVEAGALLVTIANDSTGKVEVVGDVAHDVAAAGNPVAIAARATNSIEGLTQVGAADASFITADLNGCLVTRPHTTLEELISARQSNTDGTEDAITNFAAGGAGVHNYITKMTAHNAHASSNGYIDILDGTGGTIIWTIPAPATGGAVENFDPPLKQPTANTGLFFDPSAAITTMILSLNGFQGQG